MCEHGLEGPVLGLSWDGNGYGTDGTVWGGEFLECTAADFRRIAHLRTFPLPGGDRAPREPRRSALGLLFEVLGDDAFRWAWGWFTSAELNALSSMLRRRFCCPRTSSMGRLFDAVAAICGLPPVISFEGQAAMALEFIADPDEESEYPLPVTGATPAIADWEPMARAILADRTAGVPAGKISARFHNTLAGLAVSVAERQGDRQVVLTGGCFQNAPLAARVHRRLLEGGFEVYIHHQVPPGDGGIALGQLMVAGRRVRG
jgi:hydrogenase maturation protein HypF